MPVVVACFKWVIDEAYIRRGPGGALDFSSVDYKIGEYAVPEVLPEDLPEGL